MFFKLEKKFNYIEIRFSFYGLFLPVASDKEIEMK